MIASPFPWFQGVTQQLEAGFFQGKLPHAIVLSGIAGLGKTEFALWLAQSFVCTNASSNENLSPCGACHNCQLTLAGSHPDIIHCAAEEGSLIIKVDQIRSLIETSVQSPQVGRYKVLIIDPASSMNLNAANALLKSLEEPAESTIFVLLDDQVGPLLPTLRSRCQLYKISIPSIEQTTAWLSEHLNMPGDKGDFLQAITLANGSPLEAKRLLEENGLDMQVELSDRLAATLKNQLSVVEFAELFGKENKIDLEVFLSWQAIWLEEMIRFKLASKSLEHLCGYKMFRYLAEKNAAETLYLLRDDLIKWRNEIIHGSTMNKTLVLESSLVRWKQLMRPDKVVSSLAERRA